MHPELKHYEQHIDTNFKIKEIRPSVGCPCCWDNYRPMTATANGAVAKKNGLEKNERIGFLCFDE